MKNSVQLYVNNDIFPVIEGSLTYLRVVEANDTNTYPIDSILGDNLDFIPYSSRPSNLPIITPVSNVGLCDGSLHLLAFGFRHPFTYHLGPYSNSSGYFNNLCEGAYDAYVIDNNNVSSDTAVVIINNSVNTTINSYSFGTDLPIDTHYINLNNCSFNYNATTDSGRITNITILPGNSNAAILTFEIWQNGVSSSYSDTLFAIRDSTLNMVNFVMYCDTNGRAVHGTLTLIDYFVKDSNGNLLLKIKDNDFSKNINLYPVPVDAELFVNMPIPFKELQLYDLTGKLLKQFSPNEKILVNDLSSGAYFISIVLNDGQKFFKTILKK